MSKKLYEENSIQDIANAIRSQNGTHDAYTVAQMGNAVRAIHTQPDLETLNATENGNYVPSIGKDGFSSVNVNVSGDEAVVQPLSVSENGTYNPPTGVDGFAPVTVDVSGGGSDDPFSLRNYIESSGVQYINTGYIVKDDTDFEMVVNFSNTGSYATIFGVRAISSTSPNALGCFICITWGSSNYEQLNWGSSMIVPSSVAQFSNFYGKKCIVKLNKGKRYQFESKDGYVVANSFSSSISATQDYPLYIFTLNTGGTIENVNYCTMKLYRFRIFESGVLVHEFVPWQENGIACLKDTVSGNLFYNAGTGDFVYGMDT